MNTSAKHSDLIHQQRPVCTHPAFSIGFLKQTCLLCEICLFSVSTRPPLHPRTFGTIKLFKLFTSWPPRQLKLYIASLSTLWSQRAQKEAGKERSEGSVKFSANGAQRYTIHIFKSSEWFWTIAVSQEALQLFYHDMQAWTFWWLSISFRCRPISNSWLTEPALFFSHLIVMIVILVPTVNPPN